MRSRACALVLLLSPIGHCQPSLVSAAEWWSESKPGRAIHGRAASLPVFRSDSNIAPSAEALGWLLRTDEVTPNGQDLSRSKTVVANMAMDLRAAELSALKECLTPLRQDADRIGRFQTHLGNLRTLVDTINVRDPQQRLRLRRESLTGLYLQLIASRITDEQWQAFPAGRPQLILRPDGGPVDGAGLRLDAEVAKFQQAWHEQSSLTRPDWMTPDREWAWALLTDSAKWVAPPSGAYVWVVRDVFSLRVDATFVDADDQFLGAAFIEIPLTHHADAGDGKDWEWLVPETEAGVTIDLVGGKDADFVERWHQFSARARDRGLVSGLLALATDQAYVAVWSPSLIEGLVDRLGGRPMNAREVRDLLARHMEQRRFAGVRYLRPRRAGFDESMILSSADETALWKGVLQRKGALVLANFDPLVTALPDRFFTHPFARLLLSAWRRLAGGNRLGYEMEFAGALVSGRAGAASRHRLATLHRFGRATHSGQNVLFAKVWPALSADAGVVQQGSTAERVYFLPEQSFRYLTRPMLFTDTPDSQRLDVAVRSMHKIVVTYAPGVEFTFLLSDPALRTGESTTMEEARKRVPPGS